MLGHIYVDLHSIQMQSGQQLHVQFVLLSGAVVVNPSQVSHFVHYF